MFYALAVTSERVTVQGQIMQEHTGQLRKYVPATGPLAIVHGMTRYRIILKKFDSRDQCLPGAVRSKATWRSSAHESTVVPVCDRGKIIHLLQN